MPIQDAETRYCDQQTITEDVVLTRYIEILRRRLRMTEMIAVTGGLTCLGVGFLLGRIL